MTAKLTSFFYPSQREIQTRKNFNNLITVAKGVSRIAAVFFLSFVLQVSPFPLLAVYCFYEAYCIFHAIEEFANYHFKVRTVLDLVSLYRDSKLFAFDKLFDSSPFLKLIAVIRRDGFPSLRPIIVLLK